MSAPDPYWQKFPVTLVFVEPGVYGGTIIERGELDNKPDVPRLVLRRRDGGKAILNVTQSRLLAELHRLQPQVGDTLKITYHGPAKKAPPGMSPTKEFSVEVIPPTNGAKR